MTAAEEIDFLRRRVSELEAKIAADRGEAERKAWRNEQAARVLGVPMETPAWWPQVVDWAKRARTSRFEIDPAPAPLDRLEDFGELRLGGPNPRGLRVAIFAADILSIEALLKRIP